MTPVPLTSYHVTSFDTHAAMLFTDYLQRERDVCLFRTISKQATSNIGQKNA